MRPLGALVIAAAFPLLAQQTGWRDPSPHTVSFVSVDTDVRLEVLDWGGSGRPLVFLAGLGNTAHVFDDFAPKFTPSFHVLAITRRGFGASSAPASGYDATRLGDDVIAVLDYLHLEHPVLAGHSIAGEELSSVGSRHPGRIAGLVYLDAAYPYAFQNGKGVSQSELAEVTKTLPPPPRPSPADAASYAALDAWFVRTRGFRIPEGETRQSRPPDSEGKPGRPAGSPVAGKLIQEGAMKYTRIDVPVLALSGMPQKPPPYAETPETVAAMDAFATRFNAIKEKQLEAFEQGLPRARVVRIPNADHYVFITHESEVLREMRAFLAGLQ